MVGKVLDLGCGTGVLFEDLKPAAASLGWMRMLNAANMPYLQTGKDCYLRRWFKTTSRK